MKKTKTKKKQSKASLVLIIVIFLFGFLVCTYPYWSNAYNEFRNDMFISVYKASIQERGDSLEDEFEKAKEYNRNHTVNASYDAFKGNAEESGAYKGLLNPMDNGVMGYLEIPKISLRLPIYHGTSETVLEKGVGHLPGTSLPVGGKSSHCALAAHRGLPSAKLFTDLNLVEEGDLFYLYILDKKLTYKVDQIKIVLPELAYDVGIERGKDYVTLFTCTPYGVNTHRLLVRGHRIANEKKDPPPTFWELYKYHVIIGAAALLILLLILFLLLRRRKKKKDEQQEME